MECIWTYRDTKGKKQFIHKELVTTRIATQNDVLKRPPYKERRKFPHHPLIVPEKYDDGATATSKNR